MKKITVHASRQYDIVIGNGLLTQIGALAAPLVTGRRAVIVSDTNVLLHYGDAITNSLIAAGFTAEIYGIPAGEEYKNLDTYADILNFLAENLLCRDDLLISLGGGVVGDLTGFVAATYLRGIAYIQIPTTLLAMVDSSVGGKTAINLPCGKNLAGAFYQPHLVLCDTATLSSLPQEFFLDGCAEVIKYGVLFDKFLFQQLLEDGPDFDRETVIARCIEWKSRIVGSDEFETGERKLLNLGHTFAHAIEQRSAYTIHHGYAVAIGIAIAGRCAENLGLCPKETVNQILSVLMRFRLPDACPYPSQELYSTIIHDKKRHEAHMDLILPLQIGHSRIVPVELKELLTIMEAGC